MSRLITSKMQLVDLSKNKIHQGNRLPEIGNIAQTFNVTTIIDFYSLLSYDGPAYVMRRYFS